MADKKISALTAASTPLAGTEVLPIVQSGSTVKVAVSNLTEGRSVGAAKVNVNTSTEFGLVNVNSTGASDTLMTLGDFTTPGNSVGIYGRVNGSGVFSIKTAGVAIRLSSDASLANPVDILNGNVVIGTSGKGIDFSATPGTGTSELLADYEEGTWTPTLTTLGTPFSSVTYDALVGGRYIRVGNVVHIQGYMRTDAVTVGSASSLVVISGLPFTSAANTGSTANGQSAVTLAASETWSTNNPSSGRVSTSSTSILLFYRTSANGDSTPLPFSSVATGADSNIVNFSATYVCV